jgi:hypothetical protein
MAKLDALIAETKEWRRFHVDQRNRGVKGAGIEALACAIRERALTDARACFAEEK